MAKQNERLQRRNFQTNRLLEYFSEKELTLQTGHEPERWPEVILKELIDNALDACESHDIAPAIDVTITDRAIRVQDNGPGLSAEVVQGVLDYGIRVSSKDAYISPTRGAQGNALKTVLAIPYVVSDGQPEPVIIMSHGQRHTIRVSLDRIAQLPQIRLDTRSATVRNGTCVEVPLGTLKRAAVTRFLPLVEGYSVFNPHATIRLRQGDAEHAFTRTTDAWKKWRPSDPTSPHWYTDQQLRTLIAAYVHAERQGGRALFVRDFIAEFRGLASTVKRKAVLDGLPLTGKRLSDLVVNGDLDDRLIATLLARMKAASTPVPPLALGVLSEAHLRTCLEMSGGRMQTYRYKRIAGSDEPSGLPFVLEVAFSGRRDRQPRRLITGINFAPTLADPFRAFKGAGLGLDGLLSNLYVQVTDSVTVVVHLTSPRLTFTDRGKASLEAV
jgi:DNA topoisomerase VI subunit B